MAFSNNSRKVTRMITKKRMSEILWDSYPQNTRVTTLDKELFDLGAMWASSVDKIDETPEEYRNKLNFINGFNFGKRKILIEEKTAEMQKENHNQVKRNELRQQGRDFYDQGGILELLSSEEMAALSDDFLIGYEEARNSSYLKNKSR